MLEGRSARARVEKRQEDRGARLATLAVRFAEDTDVGKLARGVARDYMT